MSGGAAALSVPEGLAFETYVRVRFHEIDALGHVNNAAYLNYLEQAAIDHAVFLGLGVEQLRKLGGVFVARRHDIVFMRPAYAGDVLRIVTWLGEPRGARVDRNYLVFREPEPAMRLPIAGEIVRGHVVLADDSLVVKAVTEWVFATESGSPRRIPAEIIDAFRQGQEAGSVSGGRGS